jgi:hypothetical protein
MAEKNDGFPGMALLDALEDVAPGPTSVPRRPADRKALEAISTEHGFPSREPRPASARPSTVVTRGRKFRETGRNYRFSVKLRPTDAQFIYDHADAEGLLIAEVIEKGLELIRATEAAEKGG